MASGFRDDSEGRLPHTDWGGMYSFVLLSSLLHILYIYHHHSPQKSQKFTEHGSVILRTQVHVLQIFNLLVSQYEDDIQGKIGDLAGIIWKLRSSLTERTPPVERVCSAYSSSPSSSIPSIYYSYYYIHFHSSVHSSSQPSFSLCSVAHRVPDSLQSTARTMHSFRQ